MWCRTRELGLHQRQRNNHTDDNTFSGNWYNGGNTNVATGAPHNNVLTGNVQVSGPTGRPPRSRSSSQAGIQTSTGGAFPTGNHQLVISSNALCLDVYANSAASGAVIDQWTCNGQSNQQFQFLAASGGYGELRAQNSGLDVAVSAGSTASGTPDIIQQAPSSTAAAGLWLPLPQSDGSYEFQNKNSGLCLDVYGSAGTLGQQLDQWPCKNAPGTNQDFTPR